jgi:hypothetical protein
MQKTPGILAVHSRAKTCKNFLTEPSARSVEFLKLKRILARQVTGLLTGLSLKGTLLQTGDS